MQEARRPPVPDVARESRWTDLPLAIALAVELGLLALLPRVVTVDGPAHVLGGWVLLHARDPFLQRFYDVDLTPVPNLLATLLLAGLLQLLGPDGAEKALVAAYVVGLPLGLRYALRGVDPRAGWLAVVAVPLTPHYLYTYGFYNLCLGLALSLVVVGLALRQREAWTRGAAVGLALLLVLTWSAHLLPALVAGLLVGVLVLARLRAAGAPGAARAAAAGRPRGAAGAGPVGVVRAERRRRARRPGARAVRPAAAPAAAAGAPAGRLRRRRALGRAGARRWCLLAVALLALRRRGRAGRSARPSPSPAWSSPAWYLLSPERYGPQYGLLNDRLSLFPVAAARAVGGRPAAAARRAPRRGGGGARRRRRRRGAARAGRDPLPARRRGAGVGRRARCRGAASLLKVQLWRDPPERGQARQRLPRRAAPRARPGRGADRQRRRRPLRGGARRTSRRASARRRARAPRSTPAAGGCGACRPRSTSTAGRRRRRRRARAAAGERPRQLAEAAPVLADVDRGSTGGRPSAAGRGSPRCGCGGSGGQPRSCAARSAS